MNVKGRTKKCIYIYIYIFKKKYYFSSLDFKFRFHIGFRFENIIYLTPTIQSENLVKMKG